MNEFGSVVALIASMSLVVSQVVAFVRRAFDAGGRFDGSWLWNVVALVVGLGFALGWQLNAAVALVGLVPALAGSTSAVAGVSGQILTGFIIGMGAGFWHELLDALSSISTKNRV